jgi:phosphatidylserine/phosphatidylglycerophosphate/cardiolipin synthase-like enzyme
MSDYELFSQLLNSIQRQIRILGKDSCDSMLLFTKLLKTSLYDSKNGKAAKVRLLVDKMNKTDSRTFSLLSLVKMDESFVNRLSSQNG